MMHFTAHIRSAHMLFFGMQKADTGDNILIGILNMKCAIHPPESSNAGRCCAKHNSTVAMKPPVDATLIHETGYWSHKADVSTPETAHHPNFSHIPVYIAARVTRDI